MRILIIGFILFLCWASVCRWHYVCNVRNQCGYEQVVDNKDVRTKTLNLVDNGKNIIKGYDEFRFDPKAVEPTLNANNLNFINKIATYLKENPGKRMLITGNSLVSEIEMGPDGKPKSYDFFENLAQARANAIRDLLVDAGIPVDRMDLDYNLIEEGDELTNPISFTSNGNSELPDDNGKDTDTEGTPEDFNTGGQSFTFTNMSFSNTNFEKGSAVFMPGNAFKSYADSVKIYMTKETDKTLLLTGHASNEGTDEFNLNLGKKRAESVKKYLKGLGVKTKISTDSKGENAPIYSNDTEASRSKNRRVAIQIK
jgi:outer membrane protein OmpA-like peptidoglycan-associated protein